MTTLWEIFGLVYDWYSGELTSGPERTFTTMLADAIDDLQKDRKEVLKLRRQIKKLESMLGPQAELIGNGDVRISGGKEMKE
jgi:hypothetical protein